VVAVNLRVRHTSVAAPIVVSRGESNPILQQNKLPLDLFDLCLDRCITAPENPDFFVQFFELAIDERLPLCTDAAK
jgi:hypothetical protein